MVHLAVLAFIIVAGLFKAKPSNLQPFAPYGTRGIFSGAAYVYFTYTGFDAVATSAEEVRAIDHHACVYFKADVGSDAVVTSAEDEAQ